MRGAIADQALRALEVAGALAVVVLLTCVPLSSNDFWLQVTIGGMIWNGGEIPRTVLFPFTEVRDFAFHAHEWLPSVLFYLLHHALGYDNLMFVKAALGLVTFGLACRLAYRQTASFPISLFLGLVTMTVINYRYFMRPEIFACLFVLIELNLLAEYRLTRKVAWLAGLVPLSLLWANSHGSFPVALVIVGLFAVGEAISARRATAAGPLALVALAMAAVMLVNPYGLRLFAFALDLPRWEVMQTLIVEWTGTFSAAFMGQRGFWPYAYLLAFCVAAAVAYRRHLSATEILLLLAFGLLSADRQRHIVYFALIALYVLARLIGLAPAAKEAGRRVTALLLALLAVGVGALLHSGNLYGAFPYETPSWRFTPRLIDHVGEHRLQGNVLNSYELGAELIHRFYPELRPSIDSRIDAYGEMYFLHTLRLLHDERALQEFIRHYDVRYMLLLRRDFEPVRRMDSLPRDGWHVLFADHKMVLLGR